MYFSPIEKSLGNLAINIVERPFLSGLLQSLDLFQNDAVYMSHQMGRLILNDGRRVKKY